MVKISDETITTLLVGEGLTDAQAAERLGVSRMTVSRRRKALGISQKPKRPEGYYELTEDQEEQLRDFYSSGMNDYEVAAKMHLGRGRLRAWREKEGIYSQTNKKGLTLDFCLEVSSFLDEGNTLELAASKYKVARSSISRAFKRYGLETGRELNKRPAWVNGYCLTDLQRSVLVGDLFGDGHIGDTSDRTSYYSCSHSLSQEFFLLWKYRILEPLSSRVHYGKQKNYYNPESEPLDYVSMTTWSTPCLKEFRSLCYNNGGNKRYPTEIVGMIDALALAVWFMGDGSRNRNTGVFHVGLHIDLEPIAEALTKKFGIVFKACRYEKEWHLRVMDPPPFYKLIAPYLLPGFSSKVPEPYKEFAGIKLDNKYLKESPVHVEISTETYKKLPDFQKKQIAQSLYLHYRKNGFPYPKVGLDQIKQECILMKSKDFSLDYYGKEGQRICNAFMPHRYNGKRHDSNPMSHWFDDVKFKKFIDNRLRHSGGLVSESAMRRGIALKGIPANFSPTLASSIYQEYVLEDKPTLDFSSGYGGRLLGYLVSGVNSEYHGVEPLSASYNGLLNMSKVCSSILSTKQENVHLYNAPFEDLSFDDNSFGLVFSSPPYFGLEIYGDEDTQSISRYKSYDQWLSCFWQKVIETSYSVLVPGGYFVFSIGNYLEFDMVSDSACLAQSVGFDFIRTHEIPYHNVYRGTTKSESVFVYRKPL